MRTRMTTRRWEISVRVAFSSSPSSSSSFAAVEYIIKRRRRPRDRLSLSSLWSYRLKRRRRRRRTRRRGEQSVRDNATHLKEQTKQMRFLPPKLARRFYSTLSLLSFLSLLSLLSALNTLSLSLSLLVCNSCLRLSSSCAYHLCVRVNTEETHTRERRTREFWGNDERPETRETWIWDLRRET